MMIKTSRTKRRMKYSIPCKDPHIDNTLMEHPVLKGVGGRWCVIITLFN